MGFVDNILDEFDGQLSIEDIYKMTYKEIGYLRKHRRSLREARANNPSIKDLAKSM